MKNKMACINMIESAAFNDSSLTPNKKRKRNGEILSKALKIHNKENALTVTDPCIEVKSIAQIIADNPYEVIRKPPKKKKKAADIEDSCFENAALNLNGPDERPVNPFEVQRSPIQPECRDHCFVNPGLNIRGVDKNAAQNPFEIKRCNELGGIAEGCGSSNAALQGIENPALELPPMLSIGIPFTPTINCRIDFNQLPLDAMTPSEMLSKKLVFTPTKTSTTNSEYKGSLTVISEESINISEELDCYQLELENSINERKNNKSKSMKSIMDSKYKANFAARLQEMEECEMREMEDIQEDEVITEEIIEEITIKEEQIQMDPQIKAEDVQSNQDTITNSDVEYEEDEDDDINFKQPAPFVRNYTKAQPRQSVETNQGQNTETVKGNHHSGFGSSIRKSIRKLMHVGVEKKSNEADQPPAVSIFGSIRQSLRRKPKMQQELVKNENFDVSILEDTKRKVFKDKMPRNEEVERDVLIRKTTIRNSLRRSTKEVKRHVMKSVFQKNVEDYNLK